MTSRDRPVADQPTDVDLHLHTLVSDGDESPAELARRCLAAGLRVVACTDHDSVAGVAEFAAVAEPAGLRVIPGCEVTVTWRGQELHCLAYFVDLHDEVFRDRIDNVRRVEVAWWRDWFDQAGTIGVPVDWATVARRFGADRVAYIGDYLDFFLDAAQGDPRFADYPRGNHAQLIKEWCKPGQPLNVPHPWRPELAEVVRWVAEAGGVTVLAHPARAFPADELPDRLAELAGLGLTGIEVWTTWHHHDDIDRLAGLCDQHGLVATQGSDYHGVRLKPWAPAPGLVPARAADPMEIVARLEAARPAVAGNRP